MTKNLMPEVLKMLGVEYGEKFQVRYDDDIFEDGIYIFMFDENKGLIHILPDGSIDEAPGVLHELLRGKYEIVKLPWEPREGERYCYPSVSAKNVDCTNWICCSFDFAMKALGMIYRTREEAEAHMAEDYERLTGKPLSSVE